MKRIAYTALHNLMLLSERPAAWSPWLLLPWSLLLAASAGWLWARVAGSHWGWASAALLLALAVADWGLLLALPRIGFSFGPGQPPFLALSLVRWFILLLAAVLVGARPAVPWAAQAALQLFGWLLWAQGSLVEPFRLQVSRLEIVTPHLNTAGRPFRVVQLSDLHVERLTPRDRALPGLVAGLAPDLVALTGDFLNTSYNDDPRAVADLQALLGQIDPPHGRYAILGTRDVDLPAVLRPALGAAGIPLLEDEARELLVDGHHLWIMGLNCTRDLAADAARLRQLMAQAPPGAFTLLLYHTPDLMPHAAELGVDLYLAGHTHGGQWRLPGFGAILTSSRYGKRYEAGHYYEGQTHLYVSRGLGLEGFGTPRARFFCRPEVVVVDLLPGTGSLPPPRGQEPPALSGTRKGA